MAAPSTISELGTQIIKCSRARFNRPLLETYTAIGRKCSRFLNGRPPLQSNDIIPLRQALRQFYPLGNSVCSPALEVEIYYAVFKLPVRVFPLLTPIDLYAKHLAVQPPASIMELDEIGHKTKVESLSASLGLCAACMELVPLPEHAQNTHKFELLLKHSLKNKQELEKESLQLQKRYQAVLSSHHCDRHAMARQIEADIAENKRLQAAFVSSTSLECLDNPDLSQAI